MPLTRGEHVCLASPMPDLETLRSWMMSERGKALTDPSTRQQLWIYAHDLTTLRTEFRVDEIRKLKQLDKSDLLFLLQFLIGTKRPDHWERGEHDDLWGGQYRLPPNE
jgi:hypothetical protein